MNRTLPTPLNYTTSSNSPNNTLLQPSQSTSTIRKEVIQRQVSDTTMDMLHLEIVNNIIFETTSLYKDNLPKAYAVLEDMGYRVGIRLGERLSRDKPRFNENLDIIKFICKEFWTEAFKKQIDNLKTNHRVLYTIFFFSNSFFIYSNFLQGTYVLNDNRFKYLLLISTSNTADTTNFSQYYVIFPCGVIRGVLSSLGLECFVTANIPKLPSCVFTIQERA